MGKDQNRVRKSVKDMAKQLLALYAKGLHKGFAFSKDIDMQNDFERRFEFEKPRPAKVRQRNPRTTWSSLSHGQIALRRVGFGKTEVALRAAFKCVADGKQCAILVPTTILALQHYQTILKRFEGFPITAEMFPASEPPRSRRQ